MRLLLQPGDLLHYPAGWFLVLDEGPWKMKPLAKKEDWREAHAMALHDYSIVLNVRYLDLKDHCEVNNMTVWRDGKQVEITS